MKALLEGIPLKRLAWYALGLTLLLFALLGSCGCVPTSLEIPTDGTKRVGVAWSPPCLGDEPPCGGPWTHYVLDVRRDQGPWIFRLATEDTTAGLLLHPGTWSARVAAVNDSIQGPYSDPSDPIAIPAPDDDRPDIHREEDGGPR